MTMRKSLGMSFSRMTPEVESMHVFFSFLTAFFLWGIPLQSHADYIEIETIADFNFGTWSMAGNLRMQKLHCIGSSDTPRRSGWNARDQKIAYHVTANSLSDPSTFNLYRDGVVSALPTRKIPIRLYHEDIMAGNGPEQLQASQRESHAHLGQFLTCPSGINSAVTIEIDAAALEDVESGVYQETFRVLAENSDDSQETFFTVSLSVHNGSSVQLSGLNTIQFGSYIGPGNLLTQETFCVHSSSPGGGFTLQITPLLGSGSAFTLVSDLTGDVIPFHVSLSSSGSAAAAVTPGERMSGTGSAALNCNALDNVSLEILIEAVDLEAASSGRYTQSLVLLVEPT